MKTAIRNISVAAFSLFLYVAKHDLLSHENHSTRACYTTSRPLSSPRARGYTRCMQHRLSLSFLLRFFAAILSAPFFCSAASAAEPAEYRHESADLLMVLRPRTPEQMAAFYTGRGFTPAMIKFLQQQCFITVFIKNKSRDIIWLDLSRWRFRNADGPIQRLHRDAWKQRWQSMGIPLAHQSTFRWTLLPEKLDFQPDEREGGNLILPRLGKAFRIEAKFPTRADAAGTPIKIQFDSVSCAVDP